jgi:hypothetical protein
MALFKYHFNYTTKEKDKLVEGEEFVKANELVEEINESRGGSPTPSKRGTYTNRDMKLVSIHSNMAMHVSRENSAQCLTKK